MRNAFATLSDCLRKAYEDDREAVDFVIRFHLPGSRREQTDSCRANLISATHKEERVVVDVAKVLPARRCERGRKRTVCVKRGTHFDARLYPPVPLVLLEHFLFKEETRVETAHVSVRLGAAVLRFCEGQERSVRHQPSRSRRSCESDRDQQTDQRA